MTLSETQASPATPATSSDDESQTSGPDASSGEQALELLNDPTKNSTRTTQAAIDLGRLSPERMATLHIISEQVADGYTETELAQALGRTPSWVSEKISELRTELLAQQGLLPELNKAEEASLRDSIAEHGVRSPVLIALVDNRLDMIDGRNRYRIANDVGVMGTMPWHYLGELSPDEAHYLKITLNTARRSLNTGQKRILIHAELMRDPARSDRSIAAICGVTHPTVATERLKIHQQQQELADHPEAPEHDPLEKLTSQYPDKRVSSSGRELGGASAPAAPEIAPTEAEQHPSIDLEPATDVTPIEASIEDRGPSPSATAVAHPDSITIVMPTISEPGSTTQPSNGKIALHVTGHEKRLIIAALLICDSNREVLEDDLLPGWKRLADKIKAA